MTDTLTTAAFAMPIVVGVVLALWSALRLNTYTPRNGDRRVRLASGGYVRDTNPLSVRRRHPDFGVFKPSELTTIVHALGQPATIEQFSNGRWITVKRIP